MTEEASAGTTSISANGSGAHGNALRVAAHPLRRAGAALVAVAALAACSAQAAGSSPLPSSHVSASPASAGSAESRSPTAIASPSAIAKSPPSTTTMTNAMTNTSLPLRAAFYYPWYPENFANNGSHYLPSAGHYNGDDPHVVDRQITDMQYAGLQAGISSWWGRGRREDKRFALLLQEAEKLRFSWTVYYEPEGWGDPSPATLSSDLAYLRKYTSSPAFLHVDNKAVIFAYGDGNDGCGTVDRWRNADTTGFYVVLKVFGGYRTCRNQPNGWHQYAPGGGLDIQNGYSAACSPGFWKNDV